MSLTRGLIAAALSLLAGPAFAQAEAAPAPADGAPVTAAPAPMTASAALTLSLDSTGDIERNGVTYQCDDGTALSVQYINAAPNFLALLPVEGESHIFASALSASGARYVSGPYEWWSHQGEGTLRDLRQDENAAPLATCTEAGNTP